MFIGLDYFIDLINDGIGVGGFGCSVLVPDGIEDCLREGQGLAAALVGQAKGDVLLKVLEELVKVLPSRMSRRVCYQVRCTTA